MEDVFNTIDCKAKTEDRNKIYLEPNFELVPQVAKEWVQEVITGKCPGQNPTHKTYNGPSHRLQYSSRFRNRSSSKQYNSKHHRDPSSYQHNQGQRKMNCYYCEGDHCIKDCKNFSRDKAKYKMKTTDLIKKYKNKFRQAAKNGNISVDEIASVLELTYQVEQAEQLLESLGLSNSDSNWLEAGIKEVMIDEASSGNVILYKVRINNKQVNTLYDTGTSISVMAKHFYDMLQNKPKLAECSRNISNTSGEALIPVGKCFIHLQIGKNKKLFRDRVIMIQNLKHEYMLGQVLHRAYRFGTHYSTTGKHYITTNSEMITEAILQVTDSPIINTKGKITLPPMSASVISIKTWPLCNTNDVYKLDFNTFQLPEGVILLKILHKVNHKRPQNLNIPILNTNNSFCSISRSSPLATLVLAGKCEGVQEVSWNQIQCSNAKLLPEMLVGTSLQLEPNTKSPLRTIPDADIPEARVQLQELPHQKYINMISQTTMDIGRTNLIDLDIPTEGPQLPPRPTPCPWSIVSSWTTKTSSWRKQT